MITAIIPTYRNPDYLDLCLKSATENMVKDDTEILVVVDGYVAESEEVLEKYDGIQTLLYMGNRGMQYAINTGVMQANNEYVFVVNDDNVFGTKWDSKLQTQLMRAGHNCPGTDQHFVLTVNQIEPTGPSMFNHHIHDLGQDVESFDYEEWLKYEDFFSKRGAWETMEGRCFPFVVSKKYFLAIGGLDTFYHSPNICDWDMFLKWELLEFWFPRTWAVNLYHFGSVVTKKNSESTAFAQRHQHAMTEYAWKWGANPYNEPKTNSKIPPNKQFRGFKIGE